VSRDSNRRTYAEALEDMGGEPWRKFNGTEQWFLLDEKEAREESRPTTIDTGQFRIPKPSLAEWLQKRLIWLTLGGFALTGVVVAAVLPRASLAAPPPIVINVPPPVQIAPPIQVAPAPVAPAQIAPAPIARVAAAAPKVARKKSPAKKRRRRR
jgi:hypothetical protein